MKETGVFGAVTFFAKKHPGELCGSNGLPLTPNSVIIYGRSQCLKSIDHPNLCEYLDVIRGKHERIIVTSEYYQKSLKNVEKPLEETRISKTAKEILQGLSHLNAKGIVHRSLSPSNILFDFDDTIKLFNYGLYYMCNYGKSVAFPIGSPKYMAPEIFLNGDETRSGPKVDIWSLGIILAELALNKLFWSHLKLNQIIRRILSLINCTGTVFEHIANEHGCSDAYKKLPKDLRDFINLCLTVDVRQRPTSAELLTNEFLPQKEESPEVGEGGYHIDFLDRVPLDQDSQPWYRRAKSFECRTNTTGLIKSQEDFFRVSILELSKRQLKEIYHLWQLAGGDVYSELKKQGMIKSKPPTLSLPNLVLLEGTVFGEIKDSSSMLDLRVILLPLDTLHQRLSHLTFEEFHPLIEVDPPVQQQVKASVKEEFLPLVIREKDTEYQFGRIVLYRRLLLGYPFKKDAIIKEAEMDVPPFFRGNIWAALLGVVGDMQRNYEVIDKETPTPTDRQIEVDIPRCHQYNELLSSAEGHRKLKRILKAWVASHPQYVYWQGLDSLCAPFLYLNFNNEAQAYACLSAFIPKYLHNFFLKDNSAVIQEYLAKFRHLIAFYDPALFNHLESINFIPELFAIPWFLTVFSHVFPLHKIFHLWDRLLLGDASFPLFIGLAVLNHLQDILLYSGFNECILLFSDLPEIDIESCVKYSTEKYKNTPRSITYRRHELRPTPAGDVDPDLEMTPMTVAQLQKECCPHISGSDLLALIEANRNSENKSYVTIDIRNLNDHQSLTLPGSVHIPFNTVSFSEKEVPKTREGNLLTKSKGKIIVIMGSGGENLAEFCKWLVQLGFPKVCSLHGGIQFDSNKFDIISGHFLKNMSG
ncbi:hypothetical protein RUM44_007775 [Polyplax serrata]|uniref:non-specific serine/threonine protein kinase n=1 Tax=Polyplax serrata TaxID=468196 RepID=A0ABR1B8A0_POLSC